MNPLIHTITISTAAGDGTIIAVSRTRTRGNSVIADRVEARDYDCFATTRVNSRSGAQHEILTQESPDHSTPDRVWVELFDLLCMKLMMSASLRCTTVLKEQDDLGSISLPGQPDRVGLVVCLPKNSEEEDVSINGKQMPEMLKAMGFKTKADTYLKPKPPTAPKPPTFDPLYKDSPYPDDYNDLPSDPKSPF